MKKLFFLLSISSCGFLHAQINLNSGLTGYFPLDGNANDMSPTAINGTNNGGSLTTGFDGSPNTALNFVSAQSDYVDAGNNNRGITDQMSISLWFRVSGNGNYELAEKYNWTMDAGFYIRMANGQIYFQGRDQTGVGHAPPPAPNVYNDGQWHHLVAIVNVTHWILYVDCEQIQDYVTTSVAPDISVNWPLTFGRYALDNNTYLDGDLDEVRLYNRVLTTDEICYLCGTSANFNNQLVGYFKLDGNANDDSPTAINGTNNGAAATTGFQAMPNTAMDFVAAQSDYIDAGNNNRGITNQMSVSFWFKTTGTGAYHLVEKYNWNLDAGFYIPFINGQIALHGRDGSGVGVAPALSSASYNDGQWHHVMAIVNQTDWLLYVDCQLIQSVTTSTVAPDISVNWPLTFGRYTLDNTDYFDGQLDEIRIYSRPLSNTEICHLCNNTVLMGINEPTTSQPLFMVYPNPTNSIINIGGLTHIAGDYFVQVCNITGQQLTRVKNQSSIDLTNYASGIYILELYDGANNKVFNQKIIKQ